jgi:glycosyltransferase involved in cell wall biosynthesis
MTNSITIVDPWGKSGLNEYMDFYTDAILQFNPKVKVITNYYSNINPKQGLLLGKIFFKFSENLLKPKYLRLLIRGIEYFILQLYIALFSRTSIIHFQWFLYPAIDIYVIGILKLRGKKVYFTAHNSKHHNRKLAKADIKILRNVDLIFVHGKTIKNDIQSYGIDKSKVIKIPHGSKHKYITSNKEIKPKELKKFVFNNCLTYLFFGLINPNKGVSELLKMWDTLSKQNNSLKLVIAGKINFKLKKEILADRNNAIIINRFMTDEELAYLLKKSQLVLMPYINGSVSGILFTAAAYKKPVLTTDFGSISEYIINNQTSFIVKDLKEFHQKLIKLSSSSFTYFQRIGINNYNFIEETCSVKSVSTLIKKYYT